MQFIGYFIEIVLIGKNVVYISMGPVPMFIVCLQWLLNFFLISLHYNIKFQLNDSDWMTFQVLPKVHWIFIQKVLEWSGLSTFQFHFQSIYYWKIIWIFPQLKHVESFVPRTRHDAFGNTTSILVSQTLA